MFWKLIKFLFVAVSVTGIKPAKMPNGNPRKYQSRLDLTLDLKVITIQEATFISKHWLNNIIDVNGNSCKEDIQIIDKINNLEIYRQNLENKGTTRNNETMILAWMPKGVYNDLLFIVCCEVDRPNRDLFVNLLVQSPFWDSSQIESIVLKESLEQLAIRANCTLHLDPLYNADSRYKLAWKNWKFD
jgi:hypothetical protein